MTNSNSPTARPGDGPVDQPAFIELLRQTEEFALDDYPSMDLFVEDVCRQLAAKWFALTKLQTRATPKEVVGVSDPYEFGDEERSTICMFEYEEEALAAVVCDNVAIAGLVDQIFGGSGLARNERQNVGLSQAELSVYSELCQHFNGEFVSTLERFSALPELTCRTAKNHEDFNAWVLGSNLVCISIDLKAGETSFDLKFIWHAELLDPLRNEQTAELEEQDPSWGAELYDAATHTPVDMRVVLGSIEMTIGQVRNLSSGDSHLILTDGRSLPVIDQANHRLFEVDLGAKGNDFCLKVVSMVTDNNRGLC